MLVRSGHGLSTRTPTRVHIHACTRTPAHTCACTTLRGCPTACPTADRAWLFDSAPSLFLPVSHLTPHQVFNCLFTRSSLVRCNISLIREQKVAHYSFRDPGSGKGLKLDLFPVFPPQLALTLRKMLGTGTPRWVRATQHRARAAELCESGDQGARLCFKFQLRESNFLCLWQQLRVARALHPSVMLTLKPNKGKCAELFHLQMSLCHVLRGVKGQLSPQSAGWQELPCVHPRGDGESCWEWPPTLPRAAAARQAP